MQFVFGKWTIGVRRPHKFALSPALIFSIKKKSKKQKWKIGLRRPHNFAFSLALICKHEIKKLTFRLKRPRNFADRHGLYYRSSQFEKWAFLSETCSHFFHKKENKKTKWTIGLRRPHNFAFSRRFFFFSIKKKTKQQKWTIGLRRPHNFACRSSALIFSIKKKTFVFVFFCGKQKWRLAWDVLTISRSLRRLFFHKKKTTKQKWTIGLRRPDNFAAGSGHFFGTIDKKLIRFFLNGRLAWDVLTFSRSRWRFVVSNKCQKQTFRLRCPRNFADQHGRIIDRYVSKTGVWPETCSHFRAQICETNDK